MQPVPPFWFTMRQGKAEAAGENMLRLKAPNLPEVFIAIRREENEPIFQEAWEGRVYAITRAIGAWGKWNIDAGRHAIELIPPAEYLRMSYYERWLARTIALIVQHGLVTQDEMETGKPAPGTQKLTPRLTADAVASAATRRGSYTRPEAEVRARFQAGDHVRARNMNPAGHTRLPRYARGKKGVVARHHGIYAGFG